MTLFAALVGGGGVALAVLDDGDDLHPEDSALGVPLVDGEQGALLVRKAERGDGAGQGSQDGYLEIRGAGRKAAKTRTRATTKIRFIPSSYETIYQINMIAPVRPVKYRA